MCELKLAERNNREIYRGEYYSIENYRVFMHYAVGGQDADTVRKGFAEMFRQNPPRAR